MPAASAAAEPAEQRRDGVPEQYTVRQTHRKDGKGLLKVPKEIEKWRPHAAQPTTVEPTLERIDEARHARRPSAKAKKLGKRRATELGWADEHDMPSEWSEDDEPMPDEDARRGASELDKGGRGSSHAPYCNLMLRSPNRVPWCSGPKTVHAVLRFLVAHSCSGPCSGPIHTAGCSRRSRSTWASSTSGRRRSSGSCSLPLILDA